LIGEYIARKYRDDIILSSKIMFEIDSDEYLSSGDPMFVFYAVCDRCEEGICCRRESYLNMATIPGGWNKLFTLRDILRKYGLDIEYVAAYGEVSFKLINRGHAGLLDDLEHLAREILDRAHYPDRSISSLYIILGRGRSTVTDLCLHYCTSCSDEVNDIVYAIHMYDELIRRANAFNDEIVVDYELMREIGKEYGCISILKTIFEYSE